MATRTIHPSERTSLINRIEKKLSSTFKPVMPSGDFVKRLKTQLASTPLLRMEQDRSSGWLLKILGVLVVILGLLLGKWLWRFLFPPEASD